MIKISSVNKFNLKDTVTCGQIFRYVELDDSYIIILKDRIIKIKQIDNILEVTSNNNNNLKNVVINYFDLKRNYDEINNFLIKQDSKFEHIINNCYGLKMIKQDPFETIIEYIISANNSVSSIRNSLNLIAQKYGKKVIFNNEVYYLFPTCNDLKNVTLEEFRTFKVGFRDKYLKQIIEYINNKKLNLDSIYSLNSNDALNKLMEYNGIGPKVASCILLFAYQKFDVYPVDTWVKKIMSEEYDMNTQKDIIDFARKTYGKYSGIAIQYMFHSRRNN